MINIRVLATVFALAAATPVLHAQAAPEPVGFAAAEGDGLSTTTGGAGGAVVTASSFEELVELVARAEPLVIEVAGTISGSGMVRLASDKTLIGRGSDAVLAGFGLHIAGRQNIIIRNLSFTGADDDAINVQDSSHHIWIDHCDLAGAHDGLIDIKRGSSWITVSWNHFHDHEKTCLLGHSDDNREEDTGRLKVTYHHNWFERTKSRHPRARFGQCHVFNNFYDRVSDYGVASTEDAEVLVEANHFLGVGEPTLVGYAASGPGELIETANLFVGSGAPETAGEVFDPTAHYAYAADPAADVPAIVREGAGVSGFAAPAAAAFARGDANSDGAIDIGDPVTILADTLGGDRLECRKAADANADGDVSIADAVYALQFLFTRGPAPDAPFPGCGVGPATSELSCERYDRCSR